MVKRSAISKIFKFCSAFLFSFSLLVSYLSPFFLSEAKASSPVEIISKRNRTSKTYQKPDGGYIWEGSIGSIHYQDAGGAWQDIHTELVPSIQSIVGFGNPAFEMTENEYEIFVLGTLNSGVPLVRYVSKNTDYWVQFAAHNLQWTNDLDQISSIATPQTTATQVSGGEARWPNAYGAGRDLRYIAGAGRMQKWLDIASPLPAPPQFIIDGGNPVIEFAEILEFHPDLEVWVNGAKWDKKAEVRTATEIEFRSPDGQVQFVFPVAMGYHEGTEDSSIIGKLHLKKSGAKLYVTARFPLSWLQSATYPIHLDTTIDKQVAASADDCLRRLSFGGYWSITAAQFRSGDIDSNYYDFRSGARFLNITIPQAATVDVGYMSLEANGMNGTPPTTYIEGEDVDDAATFSTAADYDARPRTTANVAWTPAAWVTGTWYNSSEIKTVIQEIVDRPGWVSGNDLVLFWRDADGWGGVSKEITAASWNLAGNVSGPKLHIEYTAANQNPDSPTSLAQKKTDETAIATGGWTSETSVKFTGYINDTDASDQVKLQVEVQPLGTGFTNTPSGTSTSYCTDPCTNSVTITGLTSGSQYHWQARAIDDDSATSSWVSYGGNTESERDFGVDTSAPSVSISSIDESSAYAYVSGTVVYYNTASSGSFTVNTSASDSESGIEKVNFPDTVSTGGDDPSSPYLMVYNWDTADTYSQSANATAFNNAGLTNTAAFTVTRDVSAPTGGSITYSDGYYTSASVALTVADGTDSGAGVDISTRTIQRRSATLSNGSCGGYGSWGTISPSGTYPNFTDTTVSSGFCYQYQYLVKDNVSNEAAYSSTNVVKVDTTTPTKPGTPSTTSPTTDTTPTWSWGASTDAGSGLASTPYTVQWSADPTFASGVNTSTSTTNSFTHPTALAYGTWYFRVRASDQVGNTSSWSDVGAVDITPPPPPEEEEAPPAVTPPEEKPPVVVVPPEEEEEKPPEEEIIPEEVPRPSLWSRVAIAAWSAAITVHDFAVTVLKGVGDFTSRLINTGIEVGRETARRSVDTLSDVAEASGRLVRGLGDQISSAVEGGRSLVVGIARTSGRFVGQVGSAVRDVSSALVAAARRTARVVGTQVTETSRRALAGVRSLGASIRKGVDRVLLGIDKFREIVFVTEPMAISEVTVEATSNKEVAISWKTNHLSTSKVNYGSALGVYEFMAYSSDQTREHRLVLSNLKPNTQYFYEIISKNRDFAVDAFRSFTTPTK